jgi:hypothetical protein
VASEPRIFRNKTRESGTWYHRALLTDRNNNVLVQGDFTGSCLVQVFDLAATNVDTAIYSNVRTVASVVTNTLQTWDVNPTGYQLEVAVTSNSYTRTGGHTYRTCVYLTHSAEGLHTTIFENNVETLFGV